MLTIQACEGQDLPLGRQGENYARRVAFDFSHWADTYGFGVPSLLFQRPDDSAPYPVTLTVETDTERGRFAALWNVSATDTEHAGTGRAELRYYSGETLVKSAVFHTSVTPSLATPETAPPPPGSAWAEGILAAASRAERAALDTALATGNVETVQVRTVTLEPGSPVSVSAVSENGVRTMTFSIPAGMPGRDGADGRDGINGTNGRNGTNGTDGVSVTGIETVSTTTLSGGENTYHLILSNGTKLPFSVRNGAKGDKGDPFTIAASYPSCNAMTADFSNANIPEGSFVVISSNPEDPHNAELYHKGGAAWELVTDLSGAQGMTGPAGNGIDYVEENSSSAGDTLVTLHFTDSNVQPFQFTVHQGLKGNKGDKGEKGDKGDSGDDATVNGVNALTIQAGNNNIHFSQSGSVLSISSDNTTYSPAVSGGADGLMSAADKEKLDGISIPDSGFSIPVTLSNQSLASFQSAAADRPLRVSVHILPTQTGSGNPSPSNIRPISGWASANIKFLGENVCPIQVNSSTQNGVRFTVDKTMGTVTANGTASATTTFYINNYSDRYVGYAWTLRGTPSGGGNNRYRLQMFLDGQPYKADNGTGVTFSGASTLRCGITVYSGVTVNHVVFQPMITRNDTEETITIAFTGGANPLTVYGGTLDLRTGLLSVTHGQIASYNGETLPGVWISDRDVYASGNTPATGAQVVYELASPLSYQLIPRRIAALAGTNNVFADCGPVTVTHWPGTGTPVEPVEDGETGFMVETVRQIENLRSAILALGGNL